MHKIGLIIKREYTFRICKKSFILLTLLTPFLFAALVFVPMWLASLGEEENSVVAIIDDTGKYAPFFQSTEAYTFLPVEGSMAMYRERENKEIYAFLHIADDLARNSGAAVLYSSRQVPRSLVEQIDRTLTDAVRDERLKMFEVPHIDRVIQVVRSEFHVRTVKWGDEGEATTTHSFEVASVLGLLATLLIYMFITMYGSMVMQGVMEEKTNRIIEVIVSSVKPFDLMMGKIIGIGLVGLTQVLLWGILTVAIVAFGQLFIGNTEVMLDTGALSSGATLASESQVRMAFEQLLALPWLKIIISFLLYFVGGYVLYAALFAAIGSALSQPEDSQQFITPIMILMLFSLYAGIYGIENPDGPLAFWASLVPFSSPMVMMMRLAFDVPLWQLLVSLALLALMAVAAVALSAKVYRVGILMYGKKPTLRELWRWTKIRS